MRLAFFTALSILLAGFFCHSIADPDRPSKLFLAIFAALILVAAVSKLAFSFLFIPYFLHLHLHPHLHLRHRLNLSLLQASGTSLLLVVAGFIFYNQVAAPYSNVASKLLQPFERSPIRGLVLLFEHAWLSAGQFCSSDNRYVWLML